MYASHRWQSPEGAPDDVVLGYVFLESRRHAEALADLTDAEAERVGRVAARLSEAMRTSLGAEHVFAVVIGTAVPHFHMHLFVRHRARLRTFRGTPRTSGRGRRGVERTRLRR